MTFTKEQVAELEAGQKAVSQEILALYFAIASKSTTRQATGKVEEYLLHGVCRRLKLIRRCIENIFAIFPVERSELLTEEERSDLEINLQAFVISIYGVLDNIAWAYIWAKGLGDNFKNNRAGVGLFKKSTQVHLAEDLSKYLRSKRLTTWHEKYAKDYRDALSHRIPLYVPPAFMTAVDAQTYQDLETQISDCIRTGDIDRAQALTDAQLSIGNVAPVFVHALGEPDGSRPVYFHPQVIADARTVIEIVEAIIRHIPSAAHP